MQTTSVPALIRAAEVSRDQTALLAFTAHGLRRLSRGELLDTATQLARTFRDAGLGRGDRIMIQAPNSVEWVVIALATLINGSILVPVDAQMGAADLAHVLADADPARVYTTAALRQALPASLPARIIELDTLTLPAPDAPANAMPDATTEAAVAPEDVAAVFYTSGTTGPPKGVPLTHTNLTSNVQALLEERIAGADDRVLLPLPLHHVYPFSIGLLTVLTVGATLIMPRSLVGPRIAEALGEGEATILLGVPRLYEALWNRLESRLTGGKAGRRRLLHGVIGLCSTLQTRLGHQPGRWLFRPVMKRLAPRLRLAVSGGAALDPAVGARLEALGWTVATGYGLTETSPILTLNAPGEARLDTAGRALPGVALRIVDGEVRARGPNVFAGYWNNPVDPDEVFDAEGWFRTGDAGRIDDDGYLHLAGRLSSTIVLPGGENIDPERIERVLNAQTAIREAGVLETNGRLAAVVVPEPDSEGDPQAEAEAAVDAAQGELPGHHALGDVQFSADPLPRTRLGKLRRPHLARLYEDLRAGTRRVEQRPIDPEDMAPEDQALLADATAAATLQYLTERFAEHRLTPDSRLSRDLGLDSLSWVDMGIALRERAGVELGDEAIGRVETVRDLLQEVIQADLAMGDDDDRAGQSLIQALQSPEALLGDADRRALAPRGPLRHGAARLALGGCRLLNRLFARIEIDGEWPEGGPYLITPRHASAYDPIALTAALSRERMEPLFWAGWTGLLFSSAWRRAFSRVARILPIDPGAAPRRSLALAAATLERGHSLVWFPEGQRATDQALQPLRPGIGLLLAAHPVPVVPVWIEGTQHVLPIGHVIPRRGAIRIRIGPPINPSEYGDDRRHIVECVGSALNALGDEDRSNE
ncbi:AMP-binding protein [Spiribacter insolitus]|uniref:AMP-binding protein n=1 Tax=Spiribacter insolitus TaxID=3122417 RepID=A0ABV3T5C6_9GAMM